MLRAGAFGRARGAIVALRRDHHVECGLGPALHAAQRHGQPQDKDQLVYERKDHKDWQFAGTVSDDGRYHRARSTA